RRLPDDAGDGPLRRAVPGDPGREDGCDYGAARSLTDGAKPRNPPPYPPPQGGRASLCVRFPNKTPSPLEGEGWVGGSQRHRAGRSEMIVGRRGSVAGVTSNELPATSSTGQPFIASRKSETGRIGRLIFPSIL